MTCRVTGHDIAYHCDGEGETVLLVHGITTDSFIWRKFVPLLKAALPDNQYRPFRPVRGSGSILPVDDEKMITDLGKMMLEKLGYRVETAGSGSEAIKKYTEKNADIVILDMIMPDMGGGDVFDRGCTGFIQKPFGRVVLSEKLRTALPPVNPSIPHQIDNSMPGITDSRPHDSCFRILFAAF